MCSPATLARVGRLNETFTLLGAMRQHGLRPSQDARQSYIKDVRAIHEFSAKTWVLDLDYDLALAGQ